MTLATAQVGAPPDPSASQPVTTHLERRFPGEALDVCIFGDTHVEYIASFGGVLCVNPGSATLPHNMNAELVSHTSIARAPRAQELLGCTALTASGMFRAGRGRLAF